MNINTWSPVLPANAPSTDSAYMWQGNYTYSQYPQTSAPVISSPPLLNANGIKRKIDRDVLNEVSDPTLPKELRMKFQPLYCELCVMHLNSSSNAKLHYQSKNHQKKVRKYLIDYSQKTGEPLHKKAKLPSNASKEDAMPSYCETCDLHLTSKIHAEQHFMGKNHQRAVAKIRPPAGSGYYDEHGNWRRIEKTPSDSTGRFGIGMAFAKPEEQKTGVEQCKSKYFCDLCKVSTTSSEHLQMHINGQKHQKQLKKQHTNPSSYPSDNFEDLVAVPKQTSVIPEDNILASVMKNDVEKKDYSVFRTPTGWYYCQPCNLTMNSESQFVQHLESKKHLKKKSTQK